MDTQRIGAVASWIAHINYSSGHSSSVLHWSFCTEQVLFLWSKCSSFCWLNWFSLLLYLLFLKLTHIFFSLICKFTKKFKLVAVQNSETLLTGTHIRGYLRDYWLLASLTLATLVPGTNSYIINHGQSSHILYAMPYHGDLWVTDHMWSIPPQEDLAMGSLRLPCCMQSYSYLCVQRLQHSVFHVSDA